MATTGSEVMRAAKASAWSGHPTLCLPIGRPVAGLLRPVVTRPGALSPADVRAITEWRNRFTSAFLTEFTATEERTARWLAEAVGPDPSRILFMVDDPDGRVVGHLGLAFIDWASGYAELDALVRGTDAAPGLLTMALEALWAWAGGALGLTTLGTRVRSDNPALPFFPKVGFRERRRVPLRRHVVQGEVRWVEDASIESPEVSIVYLELERDGG
jgi:RimJ/RimL family protein N-acetyltransferase